MGDPAPGATLSEFVPNWESTRFGWSLLLPPLVCTSGERACGCTCAKMRGARTANRPRRSRVHHPRASGTIRGAFLARPATGTFNSLRWGTPRLGQHCQNSSRTGKAHGLGGHFCPPPTLYVPEDAPLTTPPTHAHARHAPQTAPGTSRCSTREHLARFAPRFSRGLRRGGFAH